MLTVYNVYTALLAIATAVILGFIIAGTKKQSIRVAAIVAAALFVVNNVMKIIHSSSFYPYYVAALFLCIMCFVGKEKGISGGKFIAFFVISLLSFIYHTVFVNIIYDRFTRGMCVDGGDIAALYNRIYLHCTIPGLFLDTISRALGLLCAIKLFNENRNTVVIDIGNAEQTAEIVVDEPPIL